VESRYYTFRLDSSTRFSNILHGNFIGAFLTNGNEREKLYAVENTLFDIGQYLCWTEIVRRDIQYIDTGKSETTLTLTRLQRHITTTWATDEIPSPLLRLFSGEQEQLGQALWQRGKQDAWECMGYRAFLTKFPKVTDALMDSMSGFERCQQLGDVGGDAARLVGG
jgi:hypothetical protein